MNDSSLKKTLLKLGVRALAVAVITLIVLVIIGGGYGDKDPLPPSLEPEGGALLIAHRGAHSEDGSYTGIPDNSAASIIHAIQRGYKWIEVDVQYSADSVFFIMHDYNGSHLLRADVCPSKLTFAELGQYTLTSDNISTEEHVISLDSAASLVGDSVNLYLDMKGYGHTSATQQARDIADFIYSHNLESQVVVASPNILFVSYMEWKHPKIVTMLEQFRPPSSTWIQWLPRDFRPDMYANYYRHVTPALIERINKYNLIDRFVAFHTDSISFKTAIEWGIKKVMVDDGGYLDSLLAPAETHAAG